ncbi:MAG TPA: SAM-dependent chlorinase/fluorinase [Candidatus Limnocylindrales bacterium]|nr:SAM-dependent chlorinase/fluorinase [Candidatus Limnocylindrales bacterium]
MGRPVISLLTDFGARDPSAGILHGVILGIAPDAAIVDISHEVHKFQIRDGALLLWCALPYLPVGSHVAVVDPGVGTARRPVAVRAARGDVLIGPDNGLLPAAAERLGGAIDAWLLEARDFRLPVVSASFHGRDIFAPAAAHLANGVSPARLGPAIAPASLVPSPLRPPAIEEGWLLTSIVYVDTFGNVKLGATREQLERAIGPLTPGDELALRIGMRPEPVRVPWRGTFGEGSIGTILVYEDSYGRACLAENQGNAARRLALAEDDPVEVRRA